MATLPSELTGTFTINSGALHYGTAPLLLGGAVIHVSAIPHNNGYVNVTFMNDRTKGELCDDRIISRNPLTVVIRIANATRSAMGKFGDYSLHIRTVDTEGTRTAHLVISKCVSSDDSGGEWTGE